MDNRRRRNQRRKKGGDPNENDQGHDVAEVIGDNYDNIIDGSELEGGGQILRISFALSSLLGRSLKVTKVRGKREKPGLHAQHLTGILLVSSIHRGELRGASLHSSCVAYRPGPCTLTPSNSNMTADTGTAGSIGLLVQISLPCTVFLPFDSQLTLKGGTHVIQSPSVDYLTDIFAPIARRMGVNFDLVTRYRGFFPRGGGIVELRTHPLPQGAVLTPIELLDPGVVDCVWVDAHVCKVPSSVGEEMLEWAKTSLAQHSRCFPPNTLHFILHDDSAPHPPLHPQTNSSPSSETPVNCTSTTAQTEAPPPVSTTASSDNCPPPPFSHTTPTPSGNGSASWMKITVHTTTGCLLAGSGTWSRNMSPQDVATQALNQVIRDVEDGACVDEWLQDQLLVFMALAGGVSHIRVGEVSLHARTAMMVASTIAGARYELTPGGTGKERTSIITCTGIGYKSNP
ncbi:RNA 3 -terminal phosphate cyclase [Pelomyxa schiedti]|nr:RNA 3 -terminal phosphate cyclase [Pelomyxa schiedti]